MKIQMEKKDTGYKGSLQNSRNMYTYTYGDECAWKWKRREVSDSVLSKTAIFPKKQGRKREISNESARCSSLREANV